MHGPTLTSLQNPQVKHARSLHVRKHRQGERAFLVEGTRLFTDAIEAGAVPNRVFADVNRLDPSLIAILESLAASNVPVHPVSSDVLAAIADTQSPQGIVAIFPFPDLPLPTASGMPLLVVVDGVRDPGNLGTLLRAALGSGAQGLFLSPQTVDPFSPKVVRAAMGAHFRFPICQLEWGNLPAILNECEQRFAADASGNVTYDRVDWTLPSVLVIGSETGGISSEARKYALTSVSIPLEGGLESLNAAVAGAVILFEAARQRRTQ